MRLKQRQRDDLKVRAGLDGILQLRPGGSRPAGRARHEPRPGRESGPAESGDQDRRDAGQGHPDRPEGRASTRATASSPASSRASIHPCRTARSPWTSGSSAICPGAPFPISPWTARSSSSEWRTSSTWGARRSVRNRAPFRLFKVDSDGSASRVQVKIGRISVNAVEILSGLNVGDQVVLSDMSTWDAFDRVRLQ